MKKIDPTGQRYGRLVAVRVADWKGKKVRWLCVCDCGAEVVAMLSNLCGGHTRSCGCQRIAHGMSQTPTYRSWLMMWQRVKGHGPLADYERYTLRGITACERWQLFENFLADMGERPANTSLDRIDNDRGYEPGNCRWATRKEQSNNSRPRRSRHEVAQAMRRAEVLRRQALG